VKSAALKALEIEENNANAHLLLGFAALCFDWDWSGAEEHIGRAIRFGPNDPYCQWASGYWCLAMGRYEDGVAAMRRAVELDPLSAVLRHALGNACYWARQYDTALLAFQEAVELDPAWCPLINFSLCFTLIKACHSKRSRSWSSLSRGTHWEHGTRLPGL
jgi:tetratricopeptide (TPR) repeat protein